MVRPINWLVLLVKSWQPRLCLSLSTWSVHYRILLYHLDISQGSLRGVIVRAYGTVAEEDNDGGAPRYLTGHVFPGAPSEIIPDVVIHTEGTGCSKVGALGIYRGQRGRMQIEVDVVGKSCHGSMPWMGVNPLEWGARIIAEANDMYNQRVDIKVGARR